MRLPLRARVLGLAASLTLVAACASDASAPTSAGPATPASAQDDGGDQGAGAPVTVERVIDGDSVELDVDGRTVEARMIGINAPEFADCQGPAARDALADIAERQAVEMVSFGDDQFGRLLVDLSIGGESINLAMVRTGWALGQHTSDHPHARVWLAAMVDAAEGHLGMWSMKDCPVSGGLVIGDVEPDPDGPDDDVLTEEWIEITNPSTDAVDLSGWAVRDESTANRHVFDGIVLEAGDTLRLRSGCGDPTPGEDFWCADFGVWSNEGDTALLLGPTGAIEDWRLVD